MSAVKLTRQQCADIRREVKAWRGGVQKFDHVEVGSRANAHGEYVYNLLHWTDRGDFADVDHTRLHRLASVEIQPSEGVVVLDLYVYTKDPEWYLWGNLTCIVHESGNFRVLDDASEFDGAGIRAFVKEFKP